MKNMKQPTLLHKTIRFFRENTGLFYHVVIPAKIGDLVTLQDDFHSYDYFGVLAQHDGQLIIDMGHKHFVITQETKENITGGVDRFYFEGIKL